MGAITPSFDLEHDVDKEYPTEHITEELIKETAQKFIGEQLQEAPIHSAKKIDGKRAYEYARNDEEVKIKSNLITIYSFEILGISNNYQELKDEPREYRPNPKINVCSPYKKGIHVKFKIQCSKGTYIRSIARDFGQKLNSGGHLSELRRTKIGDYLIENSFEINSLDELLSL